jgi:hypothetical protein
MALRLAGIGFLDEKIEQLRPENESSAQTRRVVPVERDRLFRMVTGYSGHDRKSVTFKRKSRSRSPGTTGHVPPEQPVTFGRNRRSGPTGILIGKLSVKST